MRTGPEVAILLSGRQIASRERMFFRIAEILAERGARVAFLAAGPEPELRQALAATGTLRDLSPFPSRLGGATVPHGLRLFAAILPLARYLRETRPDALFTTSIPPNLAGLLAHRRAQSDCRIVLRQSNSVWLPQVTEFSGVARRWRDRLIPKLYARADAIIANSGGVARNLLGLGLAPERIVAIPNGIDCNWIARQVDEATRPTQQAPKTGRTIVTAGRLVPQKDQATLIRAFAAISGKVECRLLVLGSGPELTGLQTLARTLGITDRVRFAGHQANPYAFFARADVFVLSSRYEGMPNVLLEALACGLPIVSTDCPSGPREILADGAFGELVKVGDWEHLAAAITRCLARPPTPERQIARAREHDVTAIASRYADVILGADARTASAAQRAAQ